MASEQFLQVWIDFKTENNKYPEGYMQKALF